MVIKKHNNQLVNTPAGLGESLPNKVDAPQQKHLIIIIERSLD